MDSVEVQGNFPRDEKKDALLKSLDRLELKYEVALQEWQHILKVVQEKKDVPHPQTSSKHLPKRLPKLAMMCDINGSLPGEPAGTMELVKVVSQCKMQEMQVRALEQTLESQTKKLAMEKSQQLHLQQQLQTVLHKKEEIQKVTQIIKGNLQREAPLAEIVERALAENAVKLAKMDKEVVKIRGEAIDLVQVHQIMNELQGQVEASCSKVMALEKKKTQAQERMKNLLAEDIKLSQNMKVFITKICSEQKEYAFKMDEKYHTLWSNVDKLLECCNKFLKLTRPEVEALRLDAYQAVASNRLQAVVSHSEVEIRDDYSQFVSAEAQSHFSETHSLGQDVTQHEDSSERVESFASSLTERDYDNPIVYVGNGNQLDSESTEVHLHHITDENEHERDTDADKQDLEVVEVQSVAKQAEIHIEHPLPNQTKLDLNTCSPLKLHHQSPSAVLTQNEKCYKKVTKSTLAPESNENDVTVTLETQLAHDVLHTDKSVNFAEVQHSPFSSENEKCSLMNKDLLVTEIVPDGALQANLSSSNVSPNEATPQVSNTSTCTLASNFSQPYVSHVSASSTFDTLFVGSYIESGTADKNEIFVCTGDNQVGKSFALSSEVMERDASVKQFEGSLFTQQEKSDSTLASQGECMPNNAPIFSAEEDSSHDIALNNFGSTSQTLTNKLSTIAPLHFSMTEGGSMVMHTDKGLRDVEVPDLNKQFFCNISSGSIVSDQTDKEPTGSVTQEREYETFSSDSLLQDENWKENKQIK